jgi:hypothetical protein
MSKKPITVLFSLAAFVAVILFGLGLVSSSVTNTIAGGVAVEDCTDGKDNDGDKLVDCEDSDCDCGGGGGVGCSPGYWKNHVDHFNAVCGSVPNWTCASLWTAITCKGSNESCGRSAAADALNAVSGCTE